MSAAAPPCSVLSGAQAGKQRKPGRFLHVLTANESSSTATPPVRATGGSLGAGGGWEGGALADSSAPVRPQALAPYPRE